MILTDEEREAALHPLGVARYSTLMSPADVHRIARAIESAVLRKLRERPADAWMRPDNRVAEESYSRTQFSRGPDKPPIGTWRPLHIIPEEHE